jgi:hypothetical protein
MAVKIGDWRHAIKAIREATAFSYREATIAAVLDALSKEKQEINFSAFEKKIRDMVPLEGEDNGA